MGPLIFVARKHQIQRKKSQLNMRLMQIQSQREKVAEQIGQAQQAKTARQNLFNSTNRMAQNNIMAAMNIMNMANNYSSGLALNQGMFNIRKEYSALSGGMGVGNKISFDANNIGTIREALGEDLFNSYIETKDGKYSLRSGKETDYSEAINDYYNGKMMNLMNANRNQELTQLANNIAMNGMMNSSNLFNNLINTISNLGDEAELESLNAIDSQLEQEQTTVETQIKMLEAELQSVDKQLDNEIKQSAPKFSLGG